MVPSQNSTDQPVLASVAPIPRKPPKSAGTGKPAIPTFVLIAVPVAVMVGLIAMGGMFILFVIMMASAGSGAASTVYDADAFGYYDTDATDYYAPPMAQSWENDGYFEGQARIGGMPITSGTFDQSGGGNHVISVDGEVLDLPF